MSTEGSIFSILAIETISLPPSLLFTVQGMQPAMEKVSSTESKTWLEENEEKVQSLSSALKHKEEEKQVLLGEVERQRFDEGVEKWLDQLTAAVSASELHAELLAAREGRVRAEVALEDLKGMESVVDELVS